MSLAFATVRANVRDLTHDGDPSDYAIRSAELDREIVGCLQLYGGMTYSGLAWSTAALTTVAGTASASFTTGIVYSMVVELRLQSDGTLLKRESADNVEQTQQNATRPRGKPTSYYLIESSAQALSARFDPVPDAAYAIDALISTIPLDSTSADLPVSDLVVRAIEYDTARRCILKMTPEQRDKRSISRDVVDDYRAAVGQFLNEERKRVMRLQAVAFLPPVVW